MPKNTHNRARPDTEARVRRGYFECRYGQLHVHNAMPAGGGFEEGTPLLCVQDFRGSGRAFTKFLALAGRERSVYAPDLPGFGESDPPQVPQTLADYAAALGDFMDTMRLRALALLGVHTGALLAAELALARPAQVTRMIMLGVAPLDPPACAPVPEQTAASPQSQSWAWQAALDYPLRERLGKLTQPLLVLRPQDESADLSARVRDLLPTARVSDLRQTVAQALAAPPGLAQAVRDFLHVT